MTAQYFYSSLCPDTPPFAAALHELGIAHEAYDIHASMRNLKAFIHLRDTSPAFAALIGSSSLGVPVLITDSGAALFTPQALLAHYR